jgi:hypothetical protein
MATADGDIAGYFFALLTVIGLFPLLLLCYRSYRHHFQKKGRLEQQLEISAHKYMMKNRQQLIQLNLETQRASLKHQSKQFLKQNASSKLTNSLLEETDSDHDHFEFLLRQKHTFWGIEDLMIKEGKLKSGECLIFQFPPGLCEDFTFYIFNNLNPLTFLFASEKNPQPMISRFVSYTTAQTFILLLYLIIEDSTMRMILDYLFSPLTLLVEYWLNLMLVCPCLPEVPKDQDQQAEAEAEEGEVEAEEGGAQSSEKTQKRNNSSHLAHKTIYHTLRVLGWFLAFPILAILITLLVLLATLLAQHAIESHLLGKFILDGILIPFLLKLVLSLFHYFWFLHPIHFVLCNFTVMTINSWTESQSNEYLLHQSSILSEQQIREEYEIRKKASYSEIDLCHCSCHCIQWTGYSRDTHYTVNICQPSCYWMRCCDAISAWYWEEDESMKSLVAAPVRYSMSLSSPSPVLMELTDREGEGEGESEDHL